MMTAHDCPRCGTDLDVEAGYCGHCDDYTRPPRHVPDLGDPERFTGGRILILVDDDALEGSEPPC